MIQKYLKRIGLNYRSSTIKGVQLNSLVEDVIQSVHPAFSLDHIERLYTYDIPKLSPDGSCSISKEKEKDPYNLAHTYGLQFRPQLLAPHPATLRLWRLNQIAERLYTLTKSDWLGIYRRMKRPAGYTLVKEAYCGRISRPEFPLTKSFAANSNNSTVGLSGKASIFQDLLAYQGPYYECDAEVQSECCLPIIDGKGIIVGIIDSESFKKNHFTNDRILQIAKVCMDLGNHAELFNPID